MGDFVSLVDPFLQRVGVYEELDIDKEAARKYLDAVQATYNGVPYHSIDHVMGVLRVAIMMWQELGLGDAVKEAVPREHALLALAYVTAAAVHDVGHQGLTNDYLIRSHHPFAITHNDVSPNESHHASAAFELLLRPDNHFVRRLPVSKYALFRETVIGLVLSTDMARHSTIVGHLQSCDFSRVNSTQVPLLLRACLKCADLGHLCMPTTEQVDWAHRLQREFKSEGDAWRRRGWHPPANLDRDPRRSSFAAEQVGFFRLTVLPLFEAVAQALPQVGALIDQARANEQHWQRVARNS